MNVDIADFKQCLNNIIKKVKMTLLVWYCLTFVKLNPSAITRVGCGWLNDTQFIFNCSIFANFTNQAKSSVNKNLRKYNFKHQTLNENQKKMICEHFNISGLPDPNGWIIRSCRGFTQSTTKDEAEKINMTNINKTTSNENNLIENLDLDCNYTSIPIPSSFPDKTSSSSPSSSSSSDEDFEEKNNDWIIETCRIIEEGDNFAWE